MTHTLKTWPEFYKQVENGKKPFELRKNDRDYKEGDTLILQEYDPITNSYTGKELRRLITYVLADAEKFGLITGYVILGLKEEDYFDRLGVLKKYGITEMGLNVKPGQKVVGLFWYGELMNGTDSEKEEAEKYILEDNEYTVKEIKIGNWRSTVVLEEFPKKHFNSVHFGIKTSLI